MAQEFKEYDKKYKQFKGKYLNYEKVNGVIPEIEILAGEIDGWPYPCKQPGIQEARKAVYFTHTHEAWQKFRVSLKGMSTRLKLARLIFRRILKQGDQWEQIRIDNYIYSLKRGGLLDQFLHIKEKNM